MNSADILKVISVMRHDFLNHLQVISGYLQLGKEEKARDYIQKTTQDLRKLSPVMHLKVPEMAAAFLWGEEMARSVEVETVYYVEDDLNGCTVPGPEAGSSLYKILQLAYEIINESKPGESNCLVIDIKGGRESCRCTLKFKSAKGVSYIEHQLGKIDSTLAEYGGRLNWTEDNDLNECWLEVFLPRRE